MKHSSRELSDLEAAIAADQAAKAEALQQGLLSPQPLTLLRLSELCALGDRMMHAAKRRAQAEVVAIDVPVYVSVLFRYIAAHSNEAVAPVDRAMHPMSSEDIELEYSCFDAPFQAYFSNWPRIGASFERVKDGLAIVLEVEGGTQASVDIIVQDFLTRFNRARPGFALVCRPQVTQ